MSSITGRKAQVVRLHSPAHVPSIGGLGNTITTKHKTQGDLDLTVLEGGNILVVHKASGTEAVLYAANIIDVILEPKGAKVVGKMELPKEV